VKKASEPSLAKLAQGAFRQAARKIIQRAEETGTPVVVWEDGQVKELPVKAGRIVRERGREKRSR
jgi:hypothetical protein